MEAIRSCGELGLNWTKVQERRQRLDEHSSDYWG